MELLRLQAPLDPTGARWRSGRLLVHLCGAYCGALMGVPLAVVRCSLVHLKQVH